MADAQLLDFDSYEMKSFYKTGSLFAHSAKAVANVGGHNDRVCDLAYEYGRSLGLAFQPGARLPGESTPLVPESTPLVRTAVACPSRLGLDSLAALGYSFVLSWFTYLFVAGGGRPAGLHGYQRHARQARAQRPQERPGHRAGAPPSYTSESEIRDIT
eukprot:1195505-Prorocentrum_minimum.AAC.9